MRRLMTSALLLGASAGHAATPAELLERWQSESRVTASAAAGNRFFHQVHGDWSCATCHTADPLARGRHAITGKGIAPLAPAADPARFTDLGRADKWFKRNCGDVIGRDCTPAEKADVLAWLMSLKPVR